MRNLGSGLIGCLRGWRVGCELFTLNDEILAINEGLCESCGYLSWMGKAVTSDNDRLFFWYQADDGAERYVSAVSYKGGVMEFRKSPGFQCELCDPDLIEKVKGFLRKIDE